MKKSTANGFKFLLFACFATLYAAQKPGPDCEILGWNAMVGNIHDMNEEECEYEIGQWDQPNYLELYVESLLGGVSSTHKMNMIARLTDMDLGAGGSFRTLELVAANGITLIGINLIWNLSAIGEEGQITVEGVCEGGKGMHRDAPLLVGRRAFPHGETELDILVLWRPNESHLRNGRVDIFANGELVGGVSGLWFGLNGHLRPVSIRYGAIEIGAREPTGVYRFSPVFPTPYHPHF